MPGRARGLSGCCAGRMLRGEGAPSLTGPPSLPGRLRARLGFPQPSQGRASVSSLRGGRRRAAACPAPPQGGPLARGSPARSARGARPGPRRRRGRARGRRPGGLPAFTRDDSEADGRRGRQRFVRAAVPGAAALADRVRRRELGPPARRPRPPPARPTPSFRRALSVPLGRETEARERGPGNRSETKSAWSSPPLGNSVQWP